MKNLIFNTAVALLVSVMSLSASTPSIKTIGSKSFILDAITWKSTTVEVSITDDNGHTFYNDSHDLVQYRKYNLENLIPGDYTITISNYIKSVENHITITEEGMVINSQGSPIFKPVININDNNLDINFMANGKETNIYILDSKNTIHQITINNSQSINKRFDITNLPSGSYNVHVDNEDGVYYKSFKK